MMMHGLANLRHVELVCRHMLNVRLTITMSHLCRTRSSYR